MDILIDKIWQGAIDGELKGPFPDITVNEGQALQLQLLDKWTATGEKLSGYKIGLTSGVSRDAFGPGIRPFGFILQSRILSSGDVLELSLVPNLGVENELVFHVAADMKAQDVTADDVREILDSVAPGFEINQSRLRGQGSNGIRVADNLSQWGIVTGKFVDIDQDYEHLSVRLSRDGELVQEVKSAGHIDNHFESIARLVNGLYSYNRGLLAGDLIITGAYARQPVKQPAHWSGQFTNLGNVELVIK